MKKIPIRNKKKIIIAYALVDDIDYDQLMHKKWHLNGSKYAVHAEYALNSRVPTHIAMHRVITKAVKGEEVDHINRNRLDNRRCNLRKVTRYQNCLNTTKRANTTSKFRGVHWSKNEHRWCAQISFNRKKINLGLFTNELDAALAYDTAARIHHGEFANTNF